MAGSDVESGASLEQLQVNSCMKMDEEKTTLVVREEGPVIREKRSNLHRLLCFGFRLALGFRLCLHVVCWHYASQRITTPTFHVILLHFTELHHHDIDKPQRHRELGGGDDAETQLEMRVANGQVHGQKAGEVCEFVDNDF